MTRLRLLTNRNAAGADDPAAHSLPTLPSAGEAPAAHLRIVRERQIATCCAWCPGSREMTEFLERLGFSVSHTICPPCEARAMGGVDA